MKKEKLQINKSNYEGYAKLYDTYRFDKEDEPRIYSALLVGIIMFGAGVFGVIFSPLPLMYGIITLTSFGMTIGAIHDIVREKKDELKKQYPYLNYKVSKQELEEALQEVGIVTKDGHGYPNIDVTSFEEKLQKYEEEKEKYLEEQKNNYCVSLERKTFNREEKVKVLVKRKK